MGTGHKFDHAPLLAPGCHTLALPDIYRIGVERFDGNSRKRREHYFHLLEELVQRLLIAGVCCDIYVDGSFLTVKPDPSDIDVIVRVDYDHYSALSDEQREAFEEVNKENIAGLDALAVASYPRGHQYFGKLIDVGNPGEAYGMEHAKVWLKGYAKLKLGETDVGNRICR